MNGCGCLSLSPICGSVSFRISLPVLLASHSACVDRGAIATMSYFSLPAAGVWGSAHLSAHRVSLYHRQKTSDHQGEKTMTLYNIILLLLLWYHLNFMIFMGAPLPESWSQHGCYGITQAWLCPKYGEKATMPEGMKTQSLEFKYVGKQCWKQSAASKYPTENLLKRLQTSTVLTQQ